MTSAQTDATVDETELLERARDDHRCQIGMVGCLWAFSRFWRFPWQKPKRCGQPATKMITVACACTSTTLAACLAHYRRMHDPHVVCSNCETQVRLGIDADI